MGEKSSILLVIVNDDYVRLFALTVQIQLMLLIQQLDTEPTNFDPINNVSTLFDLKSLNHTRLTFRGVSHNYSELFKNRR